MRILVLTNLFPTPWDPMRAAFNRQQFERLGRLHEVEIITAVDFREWMAGAKGRVEVPGLRTSHFVFLYPPGFARAFHAVCWLVSLLLQRGRLLRRRRYDCVLASWGYPDAVAAGWLARMLGIPYVVKVHGSDLNVQATHAWRRGQIGASMRRASAVVAVSRALGDKARQMGVPRSQVHVLYNGVDETRFSPGSKQEARSRLGLDVAGKLLLYVGNLKASKGCLDLLEAFPALRAQYPQARLIYVGAGSCGGELHKRAEALGCAGQVTLAGAVAHDQLGDWFRAADLVCLPSHNEGVPNVLLEAMACGTPVVATRVGGIPEVVPEQAGILVPAHQAEALSTALIEAVGRSWDRAKIISHASRFRWADNVGRLAEILQAAADRHSPRPDATA